MYVCMYVCMGKKRTLTGLANKMCKLHQVGKRICMYEESVYVCMYVCMGKKRTLTGLANKVCKLHQVGKRICICMYICMYGYEENVNDPLAH
jgi:hypothetical protein